MEIYLPRQWHRYECIAWCLEMGLNELYLHVSPFGGYVWTYYPDSLRRYW